MESVMTEKKEDREEKYEEMNTREFLNFRELARQKHIEFRCEHIGGGNYVVECEKQFMELIGY